MKLKCKNCHTVITSDLVRTKSHNFVLTDKDIEYPVRYDYKVGKVHIDNKPMLNYRPSKNIMYYLHHADVKDEFIKNKSRGCCSFDFCDIVCTCGVELGEAHDDCWQDSYAYILKGKVYA